MSRLLLQQNGNAQNFDLTGHLVSIGRAEDNALILDDDSVSSHHAHLIICGQKWVLRDLQSSNGTTCNGQPVVEVVLKEGDEIGFGGVKCQIQGVAIDADSSEAPHARKHSWWWKIFRPRNWVVLSIGLLGGVAAGANFFDALIGWRGIEKDGPRYLVGLAAVVLVALSCASWLAWRTREMWSAIWHLRVDRAVFALLLLSIVLPRIVLGPYWPKLDQHQLRALAPGAESLYQSAHRGNANAATSLGALLLRKDADSGKAYLLTAAELGDVNACLQIAQIFDQDQTVPPIETLKWFTQAIALGHPDAPAAVHASRVFRQQVEFNRVADKLLEDIRSPSSGNE